ncbi:hypothetical protein K402DRAFT_320840 [Aulographum hederae CBS 113979]|uniref:Uncharacterized protein n=1 Tax=Aulographum hederae CBS 113979 TaxID=1176131 RepID=A0A6G1HGQ8_9PEZI|nr:hypothetical protein K402DRAFT_320840 [Aulographum hederae CBS 113979]
MEHVRAQPRTTPPPSPPYHPVVNPLLAWGRPPSAEPNDEESAQDDSSLLSRPADAHQACHNYLPKPKHNAPKGRQFDHLRSNEPNTLSTPNHASALRWQHFASSSVPPRNPADPISEIVTPEWMEENLPDLNSPWNPIALRDSFTSTQQLEGNPALWIFTASAHKRQWDALYRTLMRSAYVPLGIRLTVLTMSVLALGLAGSIFHRTSRNGCNSGSSTYMALIVDVVGIVYTVYITIDEYFARPLGQRKARAKMRLLFLDLFFIVFMAANLSIAFEALTDETWACRDGIDTDGPGGGTTCPFNDDICSRQKGLVGTLVIAIVAWIGTFCVSTMRLLDKTISREGG